MSREQERIRKKLENNPIVECNKIQKKYCPELFSMFGEVADPRHQSYIKYSSRTMLGTLYYKSIAGISSMQEMTRAFNNEKVCKEYNWDYIIRYKEGCAPFIAEEYRLLPEKETIGTDIEFQNKIMFYDHDVNLIYYREKRMVKGEEKTREFSWITSISITKKQCQKDSGCRA